MGRDLGHDDFDKREKASKKLWEAGRLAEAALKEAYKSDDVEVKRRSGELLDKFKWGIYPDTPAKVVQRIQRYKEADADTKGAIVQELLDEGGDGRTAYARIAAAEDKKVLAGVRTAAAAAYIKRGLENYTKKDLDRAVKDFNAAVELDPKNYFALSVRGAIRGDKKDFDSALKDLDEAIRIQPNGSLALSIRAGIWLQKKDYDRALKDLDEVVRLDPTNMRAFMFRGGVWSEKKDYDRALKDLDEAIRLDPNNQSAFYTRGHTWTKKKDYDRALKDYDEALRLDPKDPHHYNAKAWLLASCPDKRYRDGKKALELATKACELTQWKAAFFYDVLALAHAENGDFDKAVEWVEKALKDKDYEKQYGDETRERLKLYKDKKPFREK